MSNRDRRMSGKNMFEKISVMGRVAFCIACLEKFICEKGYEKEGFGFIFRQLWSFREAEFVDDYAFKVAELAPDAVLDESAELSESEFFSAGELNEVRALYQEISEDDLKTISYLFAEINDILAYHMYTGKTLSAQYSLDIMENQVYPLMMEILDDCPRAEDFREYDIDVDVCWGIPGKM